METQVDTNTSSNLDDGLPKSREDFGYDIDHVLKKVMLRVEKMYPKKDIDKLFAEGQEQEAHEMLAKAFGKFLAEVRHVTYNPITFYSVTDDFDVSPDIKQKELCRKRRCRENYAKAFTDRYDIGIEKEDLLAAMKFLALSNKTIKSPQLTENLDDLITSESCPLPKQTLERLLGYETSEIPPKYEIETIKGYDQPTRYILKPKKEIEQTDIKQITEEESEGQAQPSTTENKQEYQDNETLKEAAVGTGVAGVTSLGVSAAACLIENAKEADDHKVSVALASIGGALITIGVVSWVVDQFKSSEKPRTKIKTCILDKEYELDKKTFLGARVLIADGRRQELFSPSGETEPVRECNKATGCFDHLEDAINGTHEELITMLPNKEERKWYITIVKSYIESHYNMMCEFPEIIDQRMKYKEDARDKRDIRMHSIEPNPLMNIEPRDAEFIRY